MAEKTSAERVRASSERNAKDAVVASRVTREERASEAALQQSKNDAARQRPSNAKADPDGDIDQRMAALLQDHERMGAR